jgi:hypothetical protein
LSALGAEKLGKQLAEVFFFNTASVVLDLNFNLIVIRMNP